jgi:hypothetical protein
MPTKRGLPEFPRFIYAAVEYLRVPKHFRWVHIVALAVSVSCSTPGGNSGVVPGTPLLADDADIDLFKVSEAVWAREARHGIAGMTDSEKVFLRVWNLEAEVNNGGFAQYFENSAGDYAVGTPDALRSVGAPEMAALAERAMEPFGPSGPPPDRDARSRAMQALPASARELWDQLDDQFYRLTSPEQGLLALVERNRRAFIAP